MSEATIYNPNLSALINAGSDALSNLYRVEITGGGLAENNKYNVRCESFDPPAFNPASTYQVRYVNEYIDRPLASTNVIRNFALTFRIDSNYTIYKEFMNARNKLFKPEESFTGTSLLNMGDADFITVSVYNIPYQGEGVAETLLCTYKRCWITEVTPPTFTTGEAKPATMTVKFAFIDMEDSHTVASANKAE